MILKNFIIILLFLIIDIYCHGISVADNYRLYTIEDLLNTEDIIKTKFGPKGNKIIFQKMPPYKSINDFSTHTLTTRYQNRIYIYDINKKTLNPLFDFDEKAGYFLSENDNGGFNKDGSKILIYRIMNGVINIGCFNFESENIIWFDIEPNLHWLMSTEPLWISSKEFIISVFPKGYQKSLLIKFPEIKKKLMNDWKAAWEGRTVTAQVEVSSPVNSEMNSIIANDFQKGSLLLVNTQTGKTRKLADGLYNSLRLSPDGRYLAGLRQGGELLLDPDYPIMAIPLSKYRLQPILFDIENKYKKIIICNDCDAFTTRVEWSVDSKNLIFFVKNYDEFWHKGRFLRYNIVSKESDYINHKNLDLAPVSSERDIAGPDRPAWIGGRLAVFARPIEKNNNNSDLNKNINEKIFNGKYRPEIYHISLDGSEMGPVSVGRPDWYLLSDNGDHLNLTKSFDKFSFELYGEYQNAIVIFADGNLWRIESDGKKYNLTSNIKTKISAPSVNTSRAMVKVSRELSLNVILTVSEEDEDWVISFNHKTGEYNELYKKKSQENNLKAISFEKKLAVVTDDKGYVRNFYIKNLLNEKKEKILEINKHLKDIRPFIEKSLHYEYRNDNEVRKLNSCMMLPPDWEPGKKYPMIVRDYPRAKGNCYSINSSSYFFRNMAALAAKGYIILTVGHAVDLLASEDRSLPFANLTDMVLTAVDAAVRQGYADPDRVGLYGLSLGGMGSLWMLTQTDRFKAAVSSHGAANFTRMYGTVSLLDSVTGAMASYGEMGFFEVPADELYLGGARPWEDPQRYVNASPFFSVDKIVTPVMLVHSDLDGHDAGEYRQMFSALRRLRKDATYVEYRGEGHSPASPANIRDHFKRLTIWYDKYLKY